MDARKDSFRFYSQKIAGCIIFGISSPLMAQSGDTIDGVFEAAGVSATSYSDSNGIELEDWSLNYSYGHRNDLKTKISAHHHYITAGKVRNNYDGNEIEAVISKKNTDKIETELTVGAIYLDNQSTNKRTDHIKYKAKITANPTAKTAVQVEYGDDLLFREAIIEDDNNQLLSGKTAKLSGTWRVAKRYIAEASTQHRKLSDGNTSNQHRVAVLYGISPDTPWVWAGVEAQSLSYDEAKTNYWSPKKYEAYALVANATFPIKKNINISLNGNINRTKEENHEWASGYSAGVGADFTLSENTHIKADALYLKSTRDNVDWDSRRIGASLYVTHY